MELFERVKEDEQIRERERERKILQEHQSVQKHSVDCLFEATKKNIYFLLRQTIGESTDAQKDEVDSSKIDTVRIEQLG